jgi:N-acetylneuraminic acid mutarotase
MFTFKGKIVVYGGIRNAMQEMDDLSIFDPSSNQWSQILE